MNVCRFLSLFLSISRTPFKIDEVRLVSQWNEHLSHLQINLVDIDMGKGPCRPKAPESTDLAPLPIQWPMASCPQAEPFALM
jgi:hypothetical protein